MKVAFKTAPRPSNQREEPPASQCPTGQCVLPARQKQTMILLHRLCFTSLPIVLLLFALLPNAHGAVPESEKNALIDFAQKTGCTDWGDLVSVVYAICFSFPLFGIVLVALLSLFAWQLAQWRHIMLTYVWSLLFLIDFSFLLAIVSLPLSFFHLSRIRLHYPSRLQRLLKNLLAFLVCHFEPLSHLFSCLLHCHMITQTGDPCDCANKGADAWNGVDCSFSPCHVTGLDMPSFGLKGYIPESIGNLTYLG